MKTVLFILPYLPKIGGVEACLFEAAHKLSHNIRIFVISELSFYELKTIRKLSFINSFFDSYEFIGYFYWQAGLIMPLILFMNTKKRFLFINSSIRYKKFQNLFFKLSLLMANKIIFDSFNSYKFHSYINQFPWFKKYKIIPFITELKVRKINFKSKNIPYIMIFRWSKEKGINQIKELSKKLKDKLLVYTFPKPDNFISPPNLFLKNGLDRKDLLDKLLSAKVHISLSPQEGFSLVAYESIKCGCVPLSLASTELSKYIEEYLNKKIKSIDDLISISTTISNYNEKEYNSLIKYLDDQIKSLPFFYKSINKLIHEK